MRHCEEEGTTNESHLPCVQRRDEASTVGGQGRRDAPIEPASFDGVNNWKVPLSCREGATVGTLLRRKNGPHKAGASMRRGRRDGWIVPAG